MKLLISVSLALRSVASVIRIPVVLLILSIPLSCSAWGADDQAEKQRPVVDEAHWDDEYTVSIDPIAKQLHPVVEELSRAVEHLSMPGASAKAKAKAAETIARLAHDIQHEGPRILIPSLHARRDAVRIKAARTLRESGPMVAYYAIRYSWLIRDHKPHLDPSPAVRAEIIPVMVLVGRAEPEPVLPALWQMIREDERLDIRLRAAAGLVHIILGLRPAPADGPVEDLIPQHAVQKYAGFLPVLRETNKVLHATLKDPDEQVRFKTLKALNELGMTRVPVQQLLDALRETNPEMRAEAVMALGALNRRRPRRVEPALIRALKDESKEVRLRAVGAVSSIPPVDMSGVRALIEALKENDANDVAGFSVCRSAAWGLARMGTAAAREAIPTILQWLNSTDPRLQSDAIRMLQAVGTADERAAPALRTMLTHKNKGVRVYAAACLSKLGRAYYQETLPVLLDCTDIRDVKNQSMGSEADGRLGLIARTLGDMGSYAETAVPKLRAILNDPKRQFVHNEVKEALQKIRP